MTSRATDYASQVIATAEPYRNGGAVAASSAIGDVATVIATALAHLGKPFVFGTQSPDTVDCSGLITYAYRSSGVKIPATPSARSATRGPTRPTRSKPAT